ncbi:hypothetical protein L2E82_50470 [Cichorium intybus]|nr:hypothetical protein L2E82_50470 [Cichorium intybus]
MAVSASMVVALKTLFSVLACAMFATLLWLTATDGLASCVDLQYRWFAAVLLNFYITFGVIGAWIVYKESSWVSATILIIIGIIMGSAITCGYIVMQFFKLSSEESSKDPLYFVLVKHKKRCMIATVIDSYIQIVALSFWVAYKESSWISAVFWILSLVCFGSIGTCVYVVRQLFNLSPQQPVSHLLFNSSNKYFLSSDPLLMVHTNV